MMRGHQGTEAGAVDERDIGHVQHDFLFAFRHQSLHPFAQCVAFLTEHDTAIQGYDRDAVHFAIRKFQCHFSFLLVENRAPDLYEPSPQSLSIIVRAGHVITADRTNQLATAGFEPLRTDGAIMRSMFVRRDRGSKNIRRVNRMIRLESVVGRHLLRCGLHGSKVYSTSAENGEALWVMVVDRFEIWLLQFLSVHDALRLTTA